MSRIATTHKQRRRTHRRWRWETWTACAIEWSLWASTVAFVLAITVPPVWAPCPIHSFCLGWDGWTFTPSAPAPVDLNVGANFVRGIEIPLPEIQRQTLPVAPFENLNAEQ